MCGRYTLRVPPDVLGDRFDASVADYEPTFNASPGQSLPVVRHDGSGTGRSIENLRWGLVPRWAEDDSESYINARAETVDEKPSFAEPYEERRCLVPADGFYEWTDEGPWYVEFERVVGLAGIWEKWVPEKRQAGLGDFGDGGEERKELETFAILTTQPNEQVARLHDRMAVVMSEEEEKEWLEGRLTADELKPRDEPADLRRVSERVNDPSNDDQTLVEGVDG